MEITDIASLSMSMHQQSTEQACGVAVARKAQDTQEQQGALLVQQLQQLPAPSAHKLDITI
ncbi:MAG: YjfB family protein [Faecalibacterium sp.]|jgi:hypothetical protein|nr:YjfB family protein [Faecalibacterium sp.]